MSVYTARDVRITSRIDNKRACSQLGLVQNKFTDQPHITPLSAVLGSATRIHIYAHECINLKTNVYERRGK